MSSLSPVVAESGAQDSFAVSVVIPAHNALPMLLGAIESTLMQSLRPQEVVVVDDRSTDGTAEVVANHFAAFPEVRILRGHFGSAAAARNAGWRETHHPWVAFLDADDLWFPQKLMRAAAALRTFPVAGWFFSDGVFKPMGGEARSWLSSYADLPKSYVGHPTAQLLEVNFILTSSVVVRRGLLESLGGFDDSMSHAEDIDLWIRLARCSPATAVPEELVTYEHHPGGLTRQIERRLMGDVELFRRLAQDADLPGPLRRRARRREALAQFKLASRALREGDRQGAWERLGKAWMFPERALPVTALAMANLLPRGVLRQLASRGAGSHALTRRAFSLSRVELRSDPALLASAREGTL